MARSATVVKGISIIGIESDDLFEILKSPVQIAFVVARSAPVVERLSIIGVEADSLSVKAYFFVESRRGKSAFEPLLRGQLFFLNLWGCFRRDLLFGGGLLRGCGCRVLNGFQRNVQESRP